MVTPASLDIHSASFWTQAATTQNATGCAPIKFIGVHGTDEGPDEGSTVDGVFAIYQGLAGDSSVPIEHVSAQYPKFQLNELIGNEIGKVNSDVTAGALAIAKLVPNPGCMNQRFVLVGYSAGAWAIDKFLRTVPDSFVEEYIAGVYLMGDPETPDGGIAANVFPVSQPYIPGVIASRFASVCTTDDPVCSNSQSGRDACFAWLNGDHTVDCPHLDYASYAPTAAEFLSRLSLAH